MSRISLRVDAVSSDNINYDFSREHLEGGLKVIADVTLEFTNSF